MGISSSISKRIRQRRIDLNMTIKQVAELIGVPASTYRDWEYGRKIPAEHLASLADRLKTTIAALVEELPVEEAHVDSAIRHLEIALTVLKKMSGQL